MPDIIATPSQNILPVWDSFEAVLFVLAGMSVGFVLGYLFPSIWRTLRRRFRSHRQYVVADISWERKLDSKIKILDIPHQEKINEDYKITEIFVIARDFVQKGEFRNAVKTYGTILTSEQATTSHIHRAMFELSQVYFALGLFIRAFDTAFELFKRRSRDTLILQFLLDVLKAHQDDEKIFRVFRIFKGIPGDMLRKKMAYLACEYASKYIEKSEHLKAIPLAKSAARIYPDSSFARTLLWQCSSIRTRQKNFLDIQSTWVAFAADLSAWIHLCRTFLLSPAAGSMYLYQLLENLLLKDPNLECLDAVKDECKESLNTEEFLKSEQIILLECFFCFSSLLIPTGTSQLFTSYKYFIEKFFEKDLFVQKIMSSFFLFSNEKKFVNNSINPEVLKLGLQAHICKNCHSVFAQFQWSCSVCHSFVPLERYLSPFTEYAFHEQNWNPHTDNRNRCTHAHFDAK